MKESEKFDNPIRCQRPIGPRQDTYLAKDKQTGLRKFVKGPFKSRELANVAIIVQKLKHYAKHGKEETSVVELPLISYEVLELIPDLFPESRHRFGIPLNQPYWFLVGPDLTEPHVPPMKLLEPNSQWSEHMLVIDWEKMQQLGIYGKIPFCDHYEGSIYHRNPKVATQLVIHILLDWVFGVGGDLASRNFIYNPMAAQVFNVDTDIVGRMEWLLGNTQICAARSKNGAFFKRFLSEGAANLALAAVRHNLRESQTEWLELMPTPSRKEALKRSELKFADIEEALVGHPRPKRAAAKTGSKTKPPRDLSPKRYYQFPK